MEKPDLKSIKKEYKDRWYEFYDDNGKTFFILVDAYRHQYHDVEINITFFSNEKITRDTRPLMQISTTYEGFKEITKYGKSLSEISRESFG